VPNNDINIEAMITDYFPLVRSLAHKALRGLPPHVDLESLVQSGMVGLLDAAKRFDPGRGVEFGYFACYRIRGEIIGYLRSLDFAGRSVRSWSRKFDIARNSLTGKLLREPMAAEMASELLLSIESYYRIEQKVANSVPVSLEEIASDYWEGEWEDPCEAFEVKELAIKVRAAIDSLPDRERTVVTLYYYEELLLREIGELLDLSEARVCQILHRATRRLRQAFD
jgi:RNA polymerase sigma factor FliA